MVSVAERVRDGGGPQSEPPDFAIATAATVAIGAGDPNRRFMK